MNILLAHSPFRLLAATTTNSRHSFFGWSAEFFGWSTEFFLGGSLSDCCFFSRGFFGWSTELFLAGSHFSAHRSSFSFNYFALFGCRFSLRGRRFLRRSGFFAYCRLFPARNFFLSHCFFLFPNQASILHRLNTDTCGGTTAASSETVATASLSLSLNTTPNRK